MTILHADASEVDVETRESSPANLLMKVESFSLLKKHGIDTHESRAFEAGGYKWKLVIIFYGLEGRSRDCLVSVYSSIAESDSLPMGWEVNALFTFFIHNQILDNYTCFRGKARRFNAVSPRWGFSRLFSRESLLDPTKGYVVDDNWVFGAEVLVIERQRVNECLSLMEAKAPIKRDWKILNFSKLEDDVWNSEEFEAGDVDWKVKLYPKGNHAPAENPHISIYVECVSFDSHQKVKAQFTLSIKNQMNGTHHSRYFDHWFTPSAEDWGLRKFISVADMNNRGFLVDDCCFLEVKISMQALVLDAPKL